MSERQVRVVVWTPCSILAALGCGGILFLWLLGMILAAAAAWDSREPRPVTPVSGTRR